MQGLPETPEQNPEERLKDAILNVPGAEDSPRSSNSSSFRNRPLNHTRDPAILYIRHVPYLRGIGSSGRVERCSSQPCCGDPEC